MYEFAIGALVGACAGVAWAALARVLRARDLMQINADTEPEIDSDAGEVLTDDDRHALSSEFQTHADAVRRQVSDYADALAGGDPKLRRALRQIEAGQSWASS